MTSAAAERFQACRWRRPAENGTPECCAHRDVLPLTGANGFDSAAWCPDCDNYKLRRTPKKRDEWDVTLLTYSANSLASCTHSPSGASSL